LGLLFLITFFILILKELIKNIRKRNTQDQQYNEFRLCILIAIIINFWPITTSGNFFGSAMTNIYIIPFAFLILRKIDLKIIK
jgi:O-antigen ligase